MERIKNPISSAGLFCPSPKVTFPAIHVFISLKICNDDLMLRCLNQGATPGRLGTWQGIGEAKIIRCIFLKLFVFFPVFILKLTRM